jgi:hypothetical protein
MQLNVLIASAILAAGIGLAGANAANAEVFTFTYNIGVYTGHGILNADLIVPDLAPGFGLFTVTDIHGIANGEVILGLTNYADADNLLSYYPTYDNITLVDFAGISFATANNNYNLYNIGYYGALDQISNPFGAPTDVSGALNVSVAAAPEPSTWAMLGLGFLSLGIIGAKRREAAVAA